MRKSTLTMVKIFGWQNKMASYGKKHHTNKITLCFFIRQQFNVTCQHDIRLCHNHGCQVM